MVGQSQTGGVKPMSIAGRYVSERERLYGMTDAERAFRKQWLQDQILSKNEPRPVPQMYKALYNPIRRFYRWPLNQVQAAIEPLVGAMPALLIRSITGKALLGLAGVYWFAYYFKYNANDWTRKSGWKSKHSREAVDIGDANFPQLSDRNLPSDYCSRGFNNVKLNL